MREISPLARVANCGRGITRKMNFLGCLLTSVLLGAPISSAAADFRLCNNTGSRVGVAVGYKDGDGWITEGWWNLSARSCETLLRGTLVARFYYLYAVDYDRGGEWSGKAYMCARDKEFTIRGVDNCLARGFDRVGFFEVDTGEQQSWTVQLTDSAEQAPERPLQPYIPLTQAPPPSGRQPSGPPADARPGNQSR
jgi:uncharacterized membrane protein